ncbi:MAG: TIGR04282 family arsenosugar biosynthesis glycosyltransferase [Chloroflexota bacterium]|nr:TIGR04282 family arsenosugar biosynthesis glycosyltransferase [Chloroflexota bacterium]
MPRNRRGLVVLAKWPRAGRAKRRLGEAIGARASTTLAYAFLRDTAALAEHSGADTILVAFAPPSADDRIGHVFVGARLVAQPLGSFGTRLARALEDGHARSRYVVLIGTDSPTLDPRVVRDAFLALESGAGCVLGPSRDGGFYLIGCSAPLPPSLFRQMPWSTSAVFALTRDRARAAGLAVTVLPAGYDVDDAASLALLRADRAGLRRARETAAALRRLDAA